MLKALLPLVFVSLAPLAQASACQLSEAIITGDLVGNAAHDNGQKCSVRVKIKSVSYRSETCRLAIPVGKTVMINTNLSIDDCPDDEMVVRGTVVLLGGGLFMTGIKR